MQGQAQHSALSCNTVLCVSLRAQALQPLDLDLAPCFSQRMSLMSKKKTWRQFLARLSRVMWACIDRTMA